MWFGLSGGLVILAAVALWQSIDAFRWRNWRRFWIASMLIVPSCLGVGAAIWMGNHYPTFNFWGNAGQRAGVGMRGTSGAAQRLSARADPKISLVSEAASLLALSYGVAAAQLAKQQSVSIGPWQWKGRPARRPFVGIAQVPR